MNMQTNLKDDPKKFWSFYGAKTKSARIPKVVCFGDQNASTPVAKAYLFYRFFASVFQKLICIQQQVRKQLQIMSFT